MTNDEWERLPIGTLMFTHDTEAPYGLLSGVLFERREPIPHRGIRIHLLGADLEQFPASERVHRADIRITDACWHCDELRKLLGTG